MVYDIWADVHMWDKNNTPSTIKLSILRTSPSGGYIGSDAQWCSFIVTTRHGISVIFNRDTIFDIL